MNISLNQANPFLIDRSYVLNGPNSISKISSHGWKGLLFNEVLPA
jgi:hypothetical protein